MNYFAEESIVNYYMINNRTGVLRLADFYMEHSYCDIAYFNETSRRFTYLQLTVF